MWFFFQRDLIFLFIISISLHYLRTVSGFFLLNNDDSFNVFGLLKNNLIFFFHLQSLDIVIHNEIRHQSLRTEMGGTLVFAESGCGGGFKLSILTNNKSHLGSNIPVYLLIYWYLLASMLKPQLLLNFCHNSVCVRLWFGGGGVLLHLCVKHSMSHNLSICTSIGSMSNGLELAFSPDDWLNIV
jgi:hypothetical protein